MRLKLPATNLTYVILCVKYTLKGEECVCQMHAVNNNKIEEFEIDVPDEAVVTMVTMNEVTNGQRVVSSQVLYDSTEDNSESNSNLKVETKVTATVETKKEKKHGQTSRTSGRQEGESSKGESSQRKSKEES